ncbi:ferredoxin-type protein NapF [Constrictibacter sp. MBR-5]|jgi:ferredoxin-type protein NapF|uniref:ferredoxin-type protein NapF n=1 Tax=Constrictibacter sp. MBR-5 TaxID=3156467 RepID=UPI00339448F9
MSATTALSRRGFLSGRTRAEPVIAEPFRVHPPWTGREGFRACTDCGACVEACPTEIVSLTGGVHLEFAAGECTFCGACAAVCPEPVFDRAQPHPFQHVAAIGEACLARAGVVCQSCGDACPERAIRFTPRRGGPFLPTVVGDSCTGCGACVSPCPVAAIGMAAAPREFADG